MYRTNLLSWGEHRGGMFFSAGHGMRGERMSALALLAEGNDGPISRRWRPRRSSRHCHAANDRERRAATTDLECGYESCLLPQTAPALQSCRDTRGGSIGGCSAKPGAGCRRAAGMHDLDGSSPRRASGREQDRACSARLLARVMVFRPGNDIPSVFSFQCPGGRDGSARFGGHSLQVPRAGFGPLRAASLRTVRAFNIGMAR